MNVLSLFDGISVGKLALERAGIKVDTYFASEIDFYAREVSKQNHPDIIQLGDIKNYESWQLPKIDSIIGGSPCQGFSMAGKRLNFNDPRSKLFFEFVKCIELFKPKYFLLENVVMQDKYTEVITKYLKVRPFTLNSSLFSAQNRPRLYWTNIPGLKRPLTKGLDLNSIDTLKGLRIGRVVGRRICPETGKRQDWNKRIRPVQRLEPRKDLISGTLTTVRKDNVVILKDGKTRYLTPEELEQLQTLPIGYTSCIPDTQRVKVIGNSWTMEALAYIFKNLEGCDHLGCSRLLYKEV